jgi:nitrous oxide reductase
MKQSKVNRRQFLLAAGAGGAVTASVLIAAKDAPEAPAVVAAVAAPKPEVKGYHTSEHIEKYYKTTMI